MLVRHYVETAGILHHCLHKVIIKSLPALLHLMRGMQVDLFRIWLDTEEKWCRLNDFNCKMVLSVDLYCIVRYRTLMYYVTGASTVDSWTEGCREMFYVAAFILLCCRAVPRQPQTSRSGGGPQPKWGPHFLLYYYYFKSWYCWSELVFFGIFRTKLKRIVNLKFRKILKIRSLYLYVSAAALQFNLWCNRNTNALA